MVSNNGNFTMAPPSGNARFTVTPPVNSEGYFNAERQRLGEIADAKGETGNTSLVYAEAQRALFHLDDMELAEKAYWEIEQFVETRTAQQRMHRAKELESNIPILRIAIAQRRKEKQSVQWTTNRSLGTAGIARCPDGVTNLMSAITERVVEITGAVTAGAWGVHTEDNPRAFGSKFKQILKYLVDLIASFALGLIFAIACGHGIGMFTPIQIIHLSRPEWLLALWFICSVLTFCTGQAVASVFRLLARTFPTEFPRKANPVTGDFKAARFSAPWLVVWLLALVGVVEIANVATEYNAFQSIAQKASREQSWASGGVDGAQENESITQTRNSTSSAPISVAMGLAITTVFVIFKAGGAIRQEESARRHAFLAWRNKIAQDELIIPLLSTVNPALQRVEQLDAELADLEPELQRLETERDCLYRTFPAEYEAMRASYAEQRTKAIRAYEMAREALLEAIKSANKVNLNDGQPFWRTNISRLVTTAFGQRTPHRQEETAQPAGNSIPSLKKGINREYQRQRPRRYRSQNGVSPGGADRPLARDPRAESGAPHQ